MTIKTLEQLIHHNGGAKWASWAWNPAAGREPAPRVQIMSPAVLGLAIDHRQHAAWRERRGTILARTMHQILGV